MSDADEVQALIVATKAIGLDGALDRIQAQPELTVPLLNGLEHMQVLRDLFGESVAAGTIRIESDRPRPGEIVQRSPFLHVDLAAGDPVARGRLPQVRDSLDRAGVPARIEPSTPGSWSMPSTRMPRPANDRASGSPTRPRPMTDTDRDELIRGSDVSVRRDARQRVEPGLGRMAANLAGERDPVQARDASYRSSRLPVETHPPLERPPARLQPEPHQRGTDPRLAEPDLVGEFSTAYDLAVGAGWTPPH